MGQDRVHGEVEGRGEVSNEHPIIPMDKWGKDHWSTLAYVETRCVDHDGRLGIRQMRCHPRLHRRLAHEGSMFGGMPAPTRLREGTTVEPHDDWSCVEDMIAEGLLTTEDEDAALCGESPRFVLTRKGSEVAGALRSHKAGGGSFATFAPSVAHSPESAATS